MSQVGPDRIVSGEVAERGRRQQGRLARVIQVGNEGTMPEDLVTSDAHGGKEETIAEQSALGQGGLRPIQIVTSGLGTIEQEMPVVRPDLGIAGHRLAVQAQVVGLRTEQDVSHPILVGQDGQFVLVSMNACPAMVALVGVAHRAVAVVRLGLAGPWLMQPSGLQDADAAGILVPGKQVQQWNLRGERKLLLQLVVGCSSPEHQAAGERKQVQLACQVGTLDGGGQQLKRAESEQVLDPAQRRTRLQEQWSRPLRQGFFGPTRKSAVDRQDAEAQGSQIGRTGFAVDPDEQFLKKGQASF